MHKLIMNNPVILYCSFLKSVMGMFNIQNIQIITLIFLRLD